MTPKQAAEQLDISNRRIRYLCAQGRVSGATFDKSTPPNGAWTIPEGFQVTYLKPGRPAKQKP